MSNLAATYYRGQIFEMAASQIWKLWKALLAHKGTIKQEMTYGGNLLPKAWAIHVWKLTLLKIWFWLAAIIYSGQSNFEYEYLGEFETEFENILGYESGDQVGSIDE
jgi:hypothetical protein